MMDFLDNIESKRALITPRELINNVSLSEAVRNHILQSRQTIANIVAGRDPRLLVIVGPCSVHDIDCAMEYAENLQAKLPSYRDTLFLVMRTYFEKPRTTIGWKGFLSDPFLDGSYQIQHGLPIARKLLCDINQLGIPTATEFLDTIIPRYLSDLISWTAIGARTTQSPLHRELASGLNMPVGFKNTTDGNIKIAVDAVHTAKHAHHYLSIADTGVPEIMDTKGNAQCHIVLRGSSKEPNYSKKHIDTASSLLTERQLCPRVMIDCSHGNSRKEHTLQSRVIDDICEQRYQGDDRILGVMIESHLKAGKQAWAPGTTLHYGQSITDSCISWPETVALLDKLHDTWKIS